MNLPTREQSGVVVASVSGRIDHTSSEAFEKSLQPLMAACSAGRPALLLDFSAVEYISSAGLRVLMAASRQAKGQKGVFAISRFNLIVPCYASVDSACKVIGQ